MREILFRGKRIDNGEWVYVDFSRYPGEKSIIMVDLLEEEDYWVSSETVGQYTGLTDKNGVKIFEGDVVLGISTYKVVFVQGGFFLSDISTPNSNLQLLSDLVSFVAVIGNIHDNPEMMEAQNDH